MWHLRATCRWAGGTLLVSVLIAEDDLMIADLAEEILIDAGYEVCGIARTVAAAVALAHICNGRRGQVLFVAEAKDAHADGRRPLGCPRGIPAHLRAVEIRVLASSPSAAANNRDGPNPVRQMDQLTKSPNRSPPDQITK